MRCTKTPNLAQLRTPDTHWPPRAPLPVPAAHPRALLPPTLPRPLAPARPLALRAPAPAALRAPAPTYAPSTPSRARAQPAATPSPAPTCAPTPSTVSLLQWLYCNTALPSLSHNTLDCIAIQSQPVKPPSLQYKPVYCNTLSAHPSHCIAIQMNPLLTKLQYKFFLQ